LIHDSTKYIWEEFARKHKAPTKEDPGLVGSPTTIVRNKMHFEIPQDRGWSIHNTKEN
jgi:hypothetical protein